MSGLSRGRLVARRSPSERPLLWDGAIGTELVARGLDLARHAPEAWILERPDEVRAVHAAHRAAGAEVLQTNSFGATRPRLERSGLAGSLARVAAGAVDLAREVADGALVVASLGPTGIDPFSTDAAARIEAAYAEAMRALAEAGADALHLETMYHPTEAVAGIAAARRAAPQLSLIVSATYAAGELGFQTPLGVPLARMTEALVDAGADALGLNCSLEARKLLGPLRALREKTELAIIVKPQGGEPSVGCKGERRGDTPERFAADCLRLLDEGADAVGGCCGASPAHVAALARALDARCGPGPIAVRAPVRR